MHGRSRISSAVTEHYCQSKQLSVRYPRTKKRKRFSAKGENANLNSPRRECSTRCTARTGPLLGTCKFRADGKGRQLPNLPSRLSGDPALLTNSPRSPFCRCHWVPRRAEEQSEGPGGKYFKCGHGVDTRLLMTLVG